MKKKLSLLSLAALVLVTASAFVWQGKQPLQQKAPMQSYFFYNITGVPSNNPADYVFDDRIGADCAENTESVCGALWEQETPPTTLSSPIGNKVSADTQGEYVAGN